MPSLLSHRRDGRRGHRRQASHCLTLPLPSPQAPPSVRRTSPHQAGGLRTATALPLCKKPSVSKLCSRLTVLQCTAFFVTQLVSLPFLVGGRTAIPTRFQETKTFLRGKKIGMTFPKLNKGEANTSSKCGCFSSIPGKKFKLYKGLFQ